MSTTERLVDKIVSAILELDVGTPLTGIRRNPVATINRALSSVGAARVRDLKDVASLRRALSSLERLL